MSKSHSTSRSPGSRGAAAQAEGASGRRRLVVVGALTVMLPVGIVLAVVLNGRSDTSVTVGADGSLPPANFPDPGVVHVHGLGVDPAGGTLYAATHSGLFRLPAGDAEATRVANRYQDTMGFTIVGPGTFLGSGHPDPREDKPSRLGLIESTDAGQSWQPLSLSGQADFHALHAAHGNVYGYEASSGEFMVSTDRTQWQTRSELAMRDFAVSPADPEALLATTEQGLAASSDGGRTWDVVPGAPMLAVLAWVGDTGAYGIAPDGQVQHSTDGGQSWSPRGTVAGPPQAVTVAVDSDSGQEVLYVAVDELGIVQSTDQGRTFTTRYAE